MPQASGVGSGRHGPQPKGWPNVAESGPGSKAKPGPKAKAKPQGRKKSTFSEDEDDDDDDGEMDDFIDDDEDEDDILDGDISEETGTKDEITDDEDFPGNVTLQDKRHEETAVLDNEEEDDYGISTSLSSSLFQEKLSPIATTRTWTWAWTGTDIVISLLLGRDIASFSCYLAIQ